jgi:hypothetical protein
VTVLDSKKNRNSVSLRARKLWKLTECGALKVATEYLVGA